MQRKKNKIKKDNNITGKKVDEVVKEINIRIGDIWKGLGKE